MCDFDSIIALVNELNKIPSPTDGEEKLIEYIAGLASEMHIPVQTISEKPYVRVAPILIGNPNAKYILVTHCDRVVRYNAGGGLVPLMEPSPPIDFNAVNNTLTGKLDNTVSLAVCLKLLLELNMENTGLLVTTAEEKRLELAVGEALAGEFHTTGGRGFCSYLQYYLSQIKHKQFICVDVRRVDDEAGVWNPAESRRMILGDGLVLRLEEHRQHTGRILSADTVLVNHIRGCTGEQNVNLVDFYGPAGTTELGRGWEKVLQRAGFAEEDYHVAWIQPPITHYHTAHEQMSGTDILHLCWLIRCLIQKFEQP